MKSKISNQFFISYTIVFVMSIITAFLAVQLMSFADSVMAKTLVKNNYTADNIMRDDYTKIDPDPIVENNGGVQVINQNLEVIYSDGLNILGSRKLTTEEFTDFLIYSKSVGVPYSIDIQYNTTEKFWLIVTFPTSIRIDLAFVYNNVVASKDMQGVIGLIVAVALFYFIMLTICAAVYSKLTAIRFTDPLKKLVVGTQGLRNGDYNTRVHLNLKNEFADLQDTFNAMAEQIGHEISIRQQSDENRKKLILDISHDLKNPLAAISGYSELCITKLSPANNELNNYLHIIHENSIRANKLLTNLFELSKLESAEFSLNVKREDICEYVREFISNYLSVLDDAGFTYTFDIPEQEIFSMIDRGQMNRVFANIMDNALKYNGAGTEISVRVWLEGSHVVVIFADNGVGIPADMAKEIFLPFVRVDISRNSQTGGTGLGLSIVRMIVQKHGGDILLKTQQNRGCEFEIRFPTI